MKKRLPVFATLLTAIRLCVDNLSFAIRITMPWFILLLLIPNLIFVLSESSSADQLASDSELSELANLLIYMVGWCSIAVLWHWRILRDSSQAHMLVTFDYRVWFYLARIVLISLIVGGATLFISLLSLLPLGVIGDGIEVKAIIILLATGVGIFIAVLFARLCIALPPIALNVPDFGLRTAWNVTEGNSIRLLLVTLLPVLPVSIVGALIAWLSIDVQSLHSFSPGLFLSIIVVQGLEFITGIVGLTVLSITYAFFADDGTGGNTPETIEQDA